MSDAPPPADHHASNAPAGSGTGRGRAIAERVAPVADRVRTRYEELAAGDGVAGFTLRAWDRFNDVNGLLLAGYLAYRLVLLLMPLLVVILALSGFDPAGSSSASQSMGLGRALASSISQAGADTARSRIPLLVTGLVAFTISAWGFLGGLQYIAAQAWRIPTRKFPGKSKAFLRLAGSLLLFGLVLFLSALIRRAGVGGRIAGTAATFASFFVANLGLGWILPRRSREWYWLLPGAAAGAVGALGLQAFATFYLPSKLADASATYGALGLTLTMLTYLYALGLLLVAMPVVNAVLFERQAGEPPGLLRRIADRIPIPATAFGMGYVPEGAEADTTTTTPPPLRPEE